jgi:hypothetical protein
MGVGLIRPIAGVMGLPPLRSLFMTHWLGLSVIIVGQVIVLICHSLSHAQL